MCSIHYACFILDETEDKLSFTLAEHLNRHADIESEPAPEFLWGDAPGSAFQPGVSSLSDPRSAHVFSPGAMSEPPTARGGADDDVGLVASPLRGERRTSLSGAHMAAIFDDLRHTESSAYLLPIIRLMRMHNGMKDGSDEISKRDLQQLAVAWGLSKQQGFWAANATETALMRALFKHARKLEESGESAQFIEAIKRPTVVER